MVLKGDKKNSFYASVTIDKSLMIRPSKTL